MVKEEYSTIKAWGLDKPSVLDSSIQTETKYWKNMARALRRRNRRKDLKIEVLEQKIEKLKDIVLP